jgi:hypothetical protein
MPQLNSEQRTSPHDDRTNWERRNNNAATTPWLPVCAGKPLGL